MLEREAFAQGLDLEYRAPEACPSAAEFRARVAQTLQRPLHELEHLGRFQVTIAAGPDDYRLTVTSEVRDERGTRSLSGPDCNSVADAGALSIAMALSSAAEEPFAGAQRSAESGAGAPRSAESPAGGAPPVLAPRKVVAQGPAPSADRSPRVPGAESGGPSRNVLALQLLGDYGTLPRVAPGARLSFGRGGQRWSARLGIEALLPTTHWADGEAGAVGGRFWLGAGRAEGCLRAAGDARSSLDACAVFEAGALTGSGVGVDVSKQSTLVWLAPGLRVAGAWPLTTRHAQAVAGVEGLVPLLSKRFTVENGRTALYHPARWVGRMDLGVAWSFE